LTGRDKQHVESQSKGWAIDRGTRARGRLALRERTERSILRPQRLKVDPGE